MKMQLKPVVWPPLIKSHRNLPGWMLVRDVVLTLLAWATLAYFLREPIALGIDYFRYPLFELNTTTLPDMALVWKRLRPFAELIVLAMVWLLVSVQVWRKRALARNVCELPLALPPDQHAALFGLDTRTLLAWQQQRIQIVHFTHDGAVDLGSIQR